MSEHPRKPPEVSPEVDPEAPGSRWITMPAVGDLLGLSERAARDWVKRHELPMRGSRPVRVSQQAVLVALAEEERVARKPPELSPEGPGSTPEAPGSGEPIEAEYRVTPEELQRAIERTGTKYVNDFASLYESINVELAKLYEGRLAERDLALAAKDQTIAAKDETIAELRRRAEAVETEAVRQREAAAAAAEAHRRRLEQERRNREALEAAQDAPGTPETPEEVSQGLWARLGRWWRG